MNAESQKELKWQFPKMTKISKKPKWAKIEPQMSF